MHLQPYYKDCSYTKGCEDANPKQWVRRIACRFLTPRARAADACSTAHAHSRANPRGFSRKVDR